MSTQPEKATIPNNHRFHNFLVANTLILSVGLISGFVLPKAFAQSQNGEAVLADFLAEAIVETTDDITDLKLLQDKEGQLNGFEFDLTEAVLGGLNPTRVNVFFKGSTPIAKISEWINGRWTTIALNEIPNDQRFQELKQNYINADSADKTKRQTSAYSLQKGIGTVLMIAGVGAFTATVAMELIARNAKFTNWKTNHKVAFGAFYAAVVRPGGVGYWAGSILAVLGAVIYRSADE